MDMKPPIAIAVAIFALALAGGAGVAAAADDDSIPIMTGSALPHYGLLGGGSTGARVRANVRSYNEMRWEGVIRQQLDVGCGAASLATILTHYFDFPTSEEEMFQALMAEALRQKGATRVEDLGFNLRHIRTVALRGGLSAAAFRVKLEDLEKVRVPAIARVTIHGYNHFVVFKQATSGRVFVADPAFGNGSYRLAAFERIWSGVLMGFARRGSTLPDEHGLQVRLDDPRGVDPDDIGRYALRGPFEAGTQPDQYRFTRLSTFRLFTPQIPGLESVFPTFLGNDIPLGRR